MRSDEGCRYHRMARPAGPRKARKEPRPYSEQQGGPHGVVRFA